MAEEIVGPVITLGVNEPFLGADFRWGEAVEHALFHDVTDPTTGQPRPAVLDDFTFYDVSGMVITVVDDVTMRHTLGPLIPTFKIRADIHARLHAEAPQDPRLNPRPEILDVVDDPTIDFTTMALRLASELQLPDSPLDPHRRGFWHNLCHRVFRHRRR